jgi:hypothetical protein
LEGGVRVRGWRGVAGSERAEAGEREERAGRFWEEHAEDECCLWCCTEHSFKNSECPGCGCEEILGEMAEGGPADLLEERAGRARLPAGRSG